ncbi:MAG TPA: outer membrane lipoprotein carrier protein LolA [Candidatus Binataceae bacterium]|nr:outer membrane lipoprotein carrier protein LolA [Candidatus Binataceae bacterium]
MAVFAISLLAPICRAQVSKSSPTPSKNLSGRFEQTRQITGIPTPLKSDGSFVLVPDEGLIWRVEHPFQATTVITKEGLDQIVNDKEVQRIDASRAPMVSRLNELLNGAMMRDWSVLRKDFAVTTSIDRHSWRTTLVPLRRDDLVSGTFASIAITGGATVDDVEITHRNGDSEHLRFFDQRIGYAPLQPEDAHLLGGKGVSQGSH